MMKGTPKLYCPTCGTLRAIEGWYEREGLMIIALVPCGHALCRSAGVEWRVRATVAPARGPVVPLVAAAPHGVERAIPPA
jgi:Zn ribbon nucleic-acid-binding protein